MYISGRMQFQKKAMNHLKDFFYNRSDAIIVLIILIAAGLLIYNRVGIIMDYPQQIADGNKAQVEEQAADETE